MKKLLFIVVAAFAMANVNAQIKIQKAFTNDLIIIGNISSGAAMNVLAGKPGAKLAEHRLYCRLFNDKVTYGILVDTENSFDDDFEFALGTDIEKARESVNAILDFMKDNELQTSLTVEDEDGRTIQINLRSRKTITIEAVDAQGAIICNKVVLTRSNLDRALTLLDTKAEQKVAKAIEKKKK